MKSKTRCILEIALQLTRGNTTPGHAPYICVGGPLVELPSFYLTVQMTVHEYGVSNFITLLPIEDRDEVLKMIQEYSSR